jgi:acetylornithine deacetylase
VEAAGELGALTAELVAADSVNPGLVPGAAGEGAVGELVATWARAAGLEVELEEALPGRANVIVRTRGRRGGRRLLFNGHLDTVGVTGIARPFEPELKEGRLFGRGAYDMKGGLAAALVAAARAQAEQLPGEVVVACVIDEELGSAGTERLLERHGADAAIVCEPTEERVCIAHKGFAGFEIELRGRAAHGSRPDLGIDAIAAMGPVLVRLEALAARKLGERGHPLLGPGSIHASLIEGGQEYSSYPARCLLRGERRTIPGEGDELLRRELDELTAGSGATVTPTLARLPFEIDAGHPFPQTLERLAGGTGFSGAAFWTDAALLAAAGIPTVVYGPCGGGAHEPEEWVELASLERCARFYLDAARNVCAAG